MAEEVSLVVQMVSPQNLDVILGELDGIVRDTSQLVFGYYQDTRASGNLEFIGDGWIRGSFLRIIADGRELGTFAVVGESATDENGALHHSLELRSALHLLEVDIADKPWTIAARQSVKSAVNSLLKSCKRPARNDGHDNRPRSPFVLESGKSQLSRLFALCDMCNNRVDVNGHGEVTISPYVEPSRRSASFEIDLDNEDGLVFDGIGWSSDFFSIPNRVSVVYRSSDDDKKEVFGRADAQGNTAASTRGWVTSDFRVIDELNPPTAAGAQRAAQEILDKVGEQVEWELKLLNAPIHVGDVVDLIVGFGPEWMRGRRKCLVKSMDLDLQFMFQTVTLKEVASR